eukprot:TRINITY_DN12407_c0_g1_i1.p1 TRINITY_DN12407_c0_g1~~TRINITY_DN12407_c0_g1_i1.p1  ORF type:complete len:207 (-),score=41.38 TRINITY_DN12407_c0_g1_i1:22-642(-)
MAASAEDKDALDKFSKLCDYFFLCSEGVKPVTLESSIQTHLIMVKSRMLSRPPSTLRARKAFTDAGVKVADEALTSAMKQSFSKAEQQTFWNALADAKYKNGDTKEAEKTLVSLYTNSKDEVGTDDRIRTVKHALRMLRSTKETSYIKKRIEDWETRLEEVLAARQSENKPPDDDELLEQDDLSEEEKEELSEEEMTSEKVMQAVS